MKKLAAILLALVLVLCSVSALAFEPVDKKDLKVGFIYIGGAEDKGFTYAHHEGTKAMMASWAWTRARCSGVKTYPKTLPAPTPSTS